MTDPEFIFCVFLKLLGTHNIYYEQTSDPGFKVTWSSWMAGTEVLAYLSYVMQNYLQVSITSVKYVIVMTCIPMYEVFQCT